jgi:hypothetical protein
MLHAVERNKTSLPQGRYGFVREASERRRTQEDEITSIVFGPLEFLDESDVARLWLHLIGETPQSIDTAWSCGITFWPKKLGRDGIEPDLCVELSPKSGETQAEKHVLILVELKWRSKAGQDQIDRQKEHGEKIAAEGWHFHKMLISNDANAIEVKNLSKNSWIDLVETLKKFARHSRSDKISRWVNLVCTFLEGCGIRHFRGFAWIKVDASFTPPSIGPAIFWQSRKFFTWSPAVDFAPYQPVHRIFWKGHSFFDTLRIDCTCKRLSEQETLFFAGQR